MTKRLLTALILFSAAIAVMGSSARAQSVSKNLSLSLSSGTVTVSGSLPNVGQSSHQLYACLTRDSGTSISANIEIEASTNGTDYFAISPPMALSDAGTGIFSPCGTVTANGYYAAVRVLVSGVSGVGTPTGTLNTTYSGSVGTTPVGGEVRSGTASTKISPIPFGAEVAFIATKSAGVKFVTYTIPQGIYIYGLTVDNPNSTTVYAELWDGVPGTGTRFLFVAVPATSAVTVPLTTPAYSAVGPSGIYFSCSTDIVTPTDPSTGCSGGVMDSLVDGVNSQVTAAGSVTHTDNGAGNTPQ